MLGGQRGEVGLQPGLHLDPEANHFPHQRQVAGLFRASSGVHSSEDKAPGSVVEFMVNYLYGRLP